MSRERRHPLSLLLVLLLLALPALAEHGHVHADTTTSHDDCQACHFWSSHQTTATPATPQPAELPKAERVHPTLDHPHPLEAVLYCHGPRGPPCSS